MFEARNSERPPRPSSFGLKFEPARPLPAPFGKPAFAAALSADDVRGLRPAIAFFGARASDLPKLGIIFPHSIVWFGGE